MPRDRSVRETIREDGLRIITKSMPSTKRVRIAVVALVGSAHDPPGKDGLFHFFEHMAFKGTETKTAKELKELFGQYFLVANAATYRLWTSYFGESVYRRTPQLCETIFDMYQNSIFPEEEIEKEKQVVFQEIARNNDSDYHKAFMELSKSLWEKNPLRKYGDGSPEDVRLITREVLQAMHKVWYVPSNTVIIGAGKIDHEALVEKAYLAFPYKEKGVSHAQWNNECFILPTQKEIIIERPEREKTIVLLGCKIPSPNEQEKNQLDILLSILAKGFDSLLWNEIREKRGLAYSVGGSSTGYSQLGHYLYFWAETLPKRVAKVKQLLHEIIYEHPINDKCHFQRTKERILDQKEVAGETPAEWYNIILNKILDEKSEVDSLNGYFTKTRNLIKEITHEEVMDLRTRLISPERLVCVVVKPK